MGLGFPPGVEPQVSSAVCVGEDGENAENWGYKEDNGPSLWSNWWSVAEHGLRQSPIDINTNFLITDDNMSRLNYQYDPANIMITNTGRSWRMDFPSKGPNLSGGPLKGDYKVGLDIL